MNYNYIKYITLQKKKVSAIQIGKGGRPPKYNSKEELEEKINQYFEECKGEILNDSEGNPMVDKWGNPIIVGKKPVTITGLALALGFSGRQTLLNYQGRKEFMDTITRAKSRVEQYAEERLFDKDGTSGAQFSLRNNFKGWNCDQESNTESLEKLDEVLKKLGGVGNKT